MTALIANPRVHKPWSIGRENLEIVKGKNMSFVVEVYKVDMGFYKML